MSELVFRRWQASNGNESCAKTRRSIDAGFCVLPMASRRRRTLCTSRRFDDGRAQKTRRYLLVPTKNMPIVFGPVWLPITGPM